VKICFVASEAVPFVKTGGLADVAGALPKALATSGCEVRLFLPLYKQIETEIHDLVENTAIGVVPVQIGARLATFRVYESFLPESDVKTYLIHCPHYFHRDSIYTDQDDESERFILFQHAVIQVLQRLQWQPDIIHCNDWQTGIIPALLQLNYNWDTLFQHTKTLFSIHNIGYQGRFGADAAIKAGFSPDDFYTGSGLEFEGSFSFLKTGIVYSDVITTVSPTYAAEIQTPEYGSGLHDVLALRKNDLHGILNGIDPNVWNPKTDQSIPFNYSVDRIANKLKNKHALLEHAKLPSQTGVALIGIISRLAHQKGVDLLQPILKDLMRLPLQIVALGSGDPELEAFYEKAAKDYPDHFFAHIGFDDKLAHLITAGCDLFLMPSLYEPCGLNQMYSLKYGAAPIVRRTGGLRDTVTDYHEYYQEGNGFTFNDFDARALFLTIKRALDIYKKPKVWQKMMKRGMVEDFSWDASADSYHKLYQIAGK